jgi:hypothetical protein
MTRLTLTLAVCVWIWINLGSVASASVIPAKESRRLNNAAVNAPALSPEALEQTLGRRSRLEYIVTERTEILLDGKACKYADVPAHARITRMEVAPDKKTVLTIHFRARK